MSVSAPRIGIIGTGRLAASLSAALHAAGYPITRVAGRSAEAARAFASSMPFPVEAADAATAVRTANVVFLCVPDGAIADAATGLPWRTDQVAVHCSGALPAGVLLAAAAPATPACLHPIQTFPSRHPEPERFHGITCGIEGGGEAGELLATLVTAMGATPLRLDGADRALYHAAAVFVSNYTVALMHAATRTWERAGLPAGAAREALAPLLTATAANLAAMPVEAALTGPVARGDTGTIAGHLQALAAAPALRELYRRLALELTAFAPANPESRATIIDLLESTPSGG